MDITHSFSYPKNLTVISQDFKPPTLITSKPDIIPGIPDGVLAPIFPIFVYWIYCSIFHIIDVYQLAEAYRIHPSEEEEAKNKAKLSDVLYDVALQHVIQVIAGIGFYKLEKAPTTGYELSDMWNLKQRYPFLPNQVIWWIYMYGFSLVKTAAAFLIIDTWQYTLHRGMHMNRYLYARFHSRHHRLQVPYAFGALYNDPVEGFLLDTCGSGIASMITRLSPRESLFVFTFATMKTVNDHCGYRFPYDPFQVIFPNNSVYHDIHHQSWGFKHNFLQPFFTLWDVCLGTKYKFIDEYKELQNKTTLKKYKEFLNEKTKNKYNKSKKE